MPTYIDVIKFEEEALKTDIFYIGFPERSLFNNIGERKSTKTEYGFDIELMEFEVPV